MSDSGRYLGYKEDIAMWKEEQMAFIKDQGRVGYEKITEEHANLGTENKRLKEENQLLKAEVADLKQRLQDILRHPIGTYKGPVHWCDLCGNPVTGMMLHHKCSGR